VFELLGHSFMTRTQHSDVFPIDPIFQAHADIHHYTWFLGQSKHHVALLGTSMMHLQFEDSHLKILSSRLLS
jgi:hypothetical protein